MPNKAEGNPMGLPRCVIWVGLSVQVDHVVPALITHRQTPGHRISPEGHAGHRTAGLPLSFHESRLPVDGRAGGGAFPGLSRRLQPVSHSPVDSD